ncbi:MAG: hypothetical protein QM733_05750 [Ilumatobacteraceae bacterium]
MPAVPLVNIERGEVVGLAVDGGDRLGGEQLVERRVADVLAAGPLLGGDDVLDGRHRGAVDGCPRGCGDGVDEHDLGADDGDLAGDLGGGARRVERDGDRAETGRGQVGHDEEAAVAAQQRDLVAPADAETGEPATQVGHLVAQRDVCRRPVAADDGDVVVRMAVDDGRDVHKGPPRRAIVPSEAARVRL